MKTYLIKTSCTMKDYNAGRYWIDRGIIGQTRIAAETIADALEGLRDAAEEVGITISKNALRNKEPVFVDVPEEPEPVQVGYIMTGKTEIYDRSANINGSVQFIDVWATFEEVRPVTFA